MSTPRLFPDPEDNRVNVEKVRRFMPPRLARTAPDDPSPIIRHAWEQMTWAMGEILRAGARRARPQCGFWGCTRQAVEADHREEKAVVGGRLAEYFGTQDLCVEHHRLKTILHDADVELRVRERVTEELFRRSRDPRRRGTE